MERLTRLALGTRGSDLAIVQSRLVAEAIAKHSPGLQLETVVIKTSGDEHARVQIEDLRAGRKGMFTQEIESALVAARIDAAVHSAKDLPSEMIDELLIAAVLPRAETGDVLVAKNNETFDTLPRGAVVATGSVRRTAQIAAVRDDIKIIDLRGNVPTRLRKLAKSDWAGIVLAGAGLERLGFTRGEFQFEGAALRSSPLPMRQFVPAGGQGVIAIQTCTDNLRVRALLADIDDKPTHLCLLAEREFLRLLQADCNSAVGVHASIRDETMTMTAQIFSPRTRAMTISRPLGVQTHLELSRELFAQIHE